MIRTVLVDDQELVRAGLRRILSERQSFQIVAECEDGDEVVAAVERTTPDLVIMDVRMKRVDGATATAAVRALEDAPPVLVLTTFDDDEVLSAALRAGAAGFQLKAAPAEDLIRAAREVAAGNSWLDPAVTERVLAAYRSRPAAAASPPPAGPLTARETDVLTLVANGLTNGEIAERLYISEATVKTHVTHIFTKLGLRDRAAAIIYAFDAGLVAPR